MSKLSYEDKINLYNDRKNGLSISILMSKYKLWSNIVKYLTILIDRHRLDILRTTKNKKNNILKS